MSKKKIEIKCSSDKTMTFNEMVPFEDNPRELSDQGFKKLKKSVLELGIFKPFLIWKKGNKILGGNQRYRVIHHLAEQEGYEVGPLPVTIIDVPEGIARTIVLRDNQSDGEWAYELLADYLTDLEKFGIDKGLTGFSDKEVTDLQKLVASPDELRDKLQKMSEGTDVNDMITKQFGISFKVPDADWAFWTAVMKKLKKESGSDEVWPCLKMLMQEAFPDLEVDEPEEPPQSVDDSDEDEPEDDDDFEVDDDFEEEEEPPKKEAKKTKLRKASAESQMSN